MNSREDKLKAFGRLLDVMDDLRAKCPWDKKQTMNSLRHLTIEETYELCDALLDEDMEEVKKELGDILLHMVFYAKIASEKKAFDIADVLNGICEKLIYRHPHIYGDVKVEDEEEVEETVIESTETDQEEEIMEVEDVEVEEVIEDVEVPFAVIENVPEYPGCERGSNADKRKCMSDKIAKFVQRKFNTDLAGDLGLSGRQRISVIFKIDKNGNVTGVRSRAPHPRLEKEAARVINMLPKMKPGRQRGKPVIVPYSLPITFQVQD